ncbi:MAG: hypothetical protein PHV36_02810 [Elusimicrobiales bacterium]|nr:hypothetical protein [Elusimicrobiales bacterium]
MFSRPKICGFLLAASAVILFSAAARAENNTLLALNDPARVSVKPAAVSARDAAPLALKNSATAQLTIGSSEYTDFDAVTSVNDQLYREGSKELLKQSVKGGAKKAAAGKVMRDAPISKEGRSGALRPVKARSLINKTKSGKPLHADPVKVNNTF